MWHEYLIPAIAEEQAEIIRGLKFWITELEEQGLINGFAFNHYYNNPPDRDELRIRFEYADDEFLATVETQLQRNVREFIPDYEVEKRIWNQGTTPESVLRAYEFGSRCAFLLLEQIEKGRIEQRWVSDFMPLSNLEQSVTPFNFQSSANHGLWNSLLVNKLPNELLIHLFLLIASARLHNMDELHNWFERNRQACEFFFQSIP